MEPVVEGNKMIWVFEHRDVPLEENQSQTDKASSDSKCLLERRRKVSEEDDVYAGVWHVKVEGGRIMRSPAPRIDK